MEALHMKGTKDAVDLERLIEEFTCWQEVPWFIIMHAYNYNTI